MSCNHRNRAQGWKHAKLSGHKNENLIKHFLDTDEKCREGFLKRTNCENEKIIATSIGGLKEKSVESVIGKRKTKSKTDLKIYLENERVVNVSIKKSLNGQVYIVRCGIFIEVFEKQFNKEIPDSVKRAINLFWSGALDASEIIEEYADKNNIESYELQMRHKSLNATTLEAYDENLYNILLNWFIENSCEIAKLCFSMGAVKEKTEWSEYVWYKNLLDENDVDEIFSIEKICNVIQKYAKQETYYGAKNGGTTIQLPFGFVQWHKKQMQFHHDFEKIKKLL